MKRTKINYLPILAIIILFALIIFVIVRIGKIENKQVAYPVVNNSNYYIAVEETEALYTVDEDYQLAKEITYSMYVSSYSK